MAEKLTARYARLRNDLDLLHSESQKEEQIDADDVHEDMSMQSEAYGQWASMAALAEADHEEDCEHLKTVEMETRAMLRAKYLDSGTKFTEDRLKEETAISPDVQFALKRSLASLRAMGQFKAAERAMFQRCEMLRSMNARQCKELTFYPEDPEAMSAYRERRDVAKLLERAEKNL